VGTHSRVGRITLKGGATLHLLPKPVDGPDPDAVERLNSALDGIKSGRRHGCAVILTTRDGGIATAYSDSKTAPMVWGAAELTRRLLER